MRRGKLWKSGQWDQVGSCRGCRLQWKTVASGSESESADPVAQLDVAENGGWSDAAVRFLSHCSCTISHLRCGLNVSVEPESFFHLETVKAAIYQIDDWAASSESSRTWTCDADSHSLVTLHLRQIERTIRSNVSLRILKVSLSTAIYHTAVKQAAGQRRSGTQSS